MVTIVLESLRESLARAILFIGEHGFAFVGVKVGIKPYRKIG